MKEKGFTTVELLITLLVAAAAFVLIATIYTSATRLTDRSEDMLAANSIAYQKMQKYEDMDFAAIPPTTIGAPDPTEIDFTSELPASLPGPKSGKIFLGTKSATLKYVHVRITYQSVSGEKELEYRTLIQAGGLGR